jgi:hypothetical protein
MPRKGTMVLASLLVFGTTSVVLGDTNNRTDYHGLVAQRPVLMTMSNGRTGAVNDAASSFAAPQRIAGSTMAWIKLTEPGGKLIHINVEHVTSVRSDTQIPGARAQLDLTSGKFQGVQENVEQVMQLISATSGAHESGEIPSAALLPHLM